MVLWPAVPERSEECEAGEIGGARGSRTPDLLNAIQALSQLSYGPAMVTRRRDGRVGKL